MDKRRQEPGKELEDQLWIRGGWSLERNWNINCGYEEAEAWKAIDSVNKRRQDPGKELEDQVRIRGGWSLERNWKIKCG